jgi:hypothetical protein
MKDAKIGDLVRLVGFDDEIIDHGIIVAEKPHARGDSRYHMIKVRWFLANQQTDWVWKNQECLEKL